MVTSNSTDASDGVLLPKTHTYRMLDAWRGLASLWVVFYHTTGPLTDKFDLRPHWFYDVALQGYLGVWIFFVISGYCIAHAAVQALGRDNGLRGYAKARFRRIFWPYWFSLPFYVGLGAVASFLVSHHYLKMSAIASQNLLHQSVFYYFSNVTLTQIVFHQKFISPVSWTLCYEVAFYILMGLVLALKLRRDTQKLTAFHVLTLGCLALWLIRPQAMIYPFDYWPAFGLGILVYDLLRYKRAATKVAFALALLLFLVLAWINPVSGYSGRSIRLTSLCAAAFALMIWLTHKYDARLMQLSFVKLLSWIGLFSYSLYLTHWLVVGLVLQLLGKMRLETPWLCLIVCPLVSVGAAFVFYQCFERPFINKKSVIIPSLANELNSK